MYKDVKDSFLSVTHEVPDFSAELPDNNIIDDDPDRLENPLDNDNIPVITEIEDEVINDTTNDEVVSDENQEDSTSNPSEEGDNDDTEYSYKALLAHLSEEGLVDFEDAEEIEDKPELVYETIKRTVEEGINSYKESIPELGQKFLSYLEQGGDANKFIATLSNPLDIDSLDISNESDQETIVREYLKELNYPDDEIKETIDEYKDAVLLEKKASSYLDKLSKIHEKRTEKLLVEQEEIRQAQAEQYNSYINDVSTTIDTAESLAGLSIAKADKDAFKKYLLAVDKEGVTQYQRDVNSNPIKTQIELAYLKFKNYDFSKAVKEGERKAVKNMKKVFRQSENTVNTGRSSHTRADEDANFDAFNWFRHKK